MPNTHPKEIFASLWRHRDLTYQLIKRDILNKYRGSFMGLLWVILSPLLMLGLYTFTFGIILRARWPGVTDSLMYALLVYVGLSIFNFFSECLNRAPNLIVSNPNLVKKIIFPLEIYPWVIIGSAGFFAIINSLILCFFCFLKLGTIHFGILLLPLLYLPLIFLTLGLCWFLCSAGVYFRDISHMMGFILQIIMYLSPIFYSTLNLPPALQKFLFISPLTYIIEQARGIIIFGNAFNWSSFIVYCCIGLGFAVLGFVWFQKTRDGFADVL
ncbi:ABC transporter permease [Legionella cardiaca]|uniref:Transport permease protein n=1 Tax=Legionella cardiaca TaxID=1071983 RepID=A0ABY8AQ88_9GAMM|nr:ABC transporter permease [Legionella cardiaca]WED42827.1 ABC transporter permease [Legionella cardiaca]